MNFWLGSLGAATFWIFISLIVLGLGLQDEIHWISLLVSIAFFAIGCGLLWRWIKVTPQIVVDKDGVRLKYFLQGTRFIQWALINKVHSNNNKQFILFLDGADNVWFWEGIYSNMDEIEQAIRKRVEKT